MTGLLALMLLIEARRPTRVSRGELVPLDEQDRGRWDRALIAEGHALVRACLAANRPGRYQLLAAVNAVHTDALNAADTDWSQIATLYDQLAAIDPSPIVELNRAIAVAEFDGPEVALALVDRLPLDDISRLACHPRRPAAPPRPQRRSARRVRCRDRGDGQRRRARVPRTASRPARPLTLGAP